MTYFSCDYCAKSLDRHIGTSAPGPFEPLILKCYSKSRNQTVNKIFHARCLDTIMRKNPESSRPIQFLHGSQYENTHIITFREGRVTYIPVPKKGQFPFQETEVFFEEESPRQNFEKLIQEGATRLIKLPADKASNFPAITLAVPIER